MANIVINRDIIGHIVEYSGDRVVLWTLRKYLDPHLYNDILLHKRRILIYGEVQSGKTAAIIDALQLPIYEKISKIIVIQNSLLVLSQYKQRMEDSNISYQVIDKDTQSIYADVVLLMNNKMRYNMFMNVEGKFQSQKYIIFMDESDSYMGGRHPLANNAVHEYYVTATPQHKLYHTDGFFHSVRKLAHTRYYKGLHNIKIEYDDSSIINIVRNFKEEVDTGMMLINAYKRVNEMISVGVLLSNEFDDIVFVTLNTNRRIIFKGVHRKLHSSIQNMSISEIIDRLSPAKYIVFIANRMSLRGLSYCSSDYSRHLTHQYSNLRQGTITNSLQRMRLFGKYVDDAPLKLILPSNNHNRINAMYELLDINFNVCREFTL
jgi:hypothetical protein